MGLRYGIEGTLASAETKNILVVVTLYQYLVDVAEVSTLFAELHAAVAPQIQNVSLKTSVVLRHVVICTFSVRSPLKVAK